MPGEKITHIIPYSGRTYTPSWSNPGCKDSWSNGYHYSTATGAVNMGFKSYTIISEFTKFQYDGTTYYASANNTTQICQGSFRLGYYESKSEGKWSGLYEGWMNALNYVFRVFLRNSIGGPLTISIEESPESSNASTSTTETRLCKVDISSYTFPTLGSVVITV